jgi:hypothetical protein
MQTSRGGRGRSTLGRGAFRWFDERVPGWLHLRADLRAIGLAVATLLCLVCLDSRLVSHAAHSGPPSPLHGLTIRLHARSSEPSAPMHVLPGLSGEVAVFREQRGYYVRVVQDALPAAGSTLELPAGRYWVLGRASGFARGAQAVRLERDQTIDLELSPALVRTVEVVHDQNGTLLPLVGASVLLRSPEHTLPFGALTDAEGRASFPSTPHGELVALVYAPGFEPYEATISGDLLVRLRPVKVLRVRVLAAGSPQAGATVSIAGLSMWPARVVQTGPRGSIDITGLRAGRYTLSATHERLVSPDVTVELQGEEGVQAVELSLVPGVFVSAKVHDPDGRPIAEARVTHGQAGVSARQIHALTDASGMFSIGPLLERGGQLQVGKAGFVTRLEQVTPEGPAEVELSKAGRVEGRVLGADGRPVAGATVEVVGTDTLGMPIAISTRSSAMAGAHFDWALESQGILLPAGELGVLLGPVPAIPLASVTPLGGEMLTTDEKGVFGVSEVPPGKILVLGRHPDHMDGRSAVVTLAPGGVARVEVTLGTGQPLRGRVVDHRGFPASDARIAVSGKGFDRHIGVAPDGTFFLAAAPEDVRLRIGRAQRAVGVLLDHRVEAQERDHELRIELPPPREKVRIVCETESGEPVQLAQVSLLSTERTAPLQLTRFTSQTGELELEDTRGLSVRLTVSAPSFVERTYELSLPAEHRIVLQRAIRAHGRVTAVRGRQPAGGAIVSYVAGGIERKAITNADGEYRLTDLPPGAGTLTVRHETEGQAQKAVSLVPDANGEASLPDVDVAPAVEIEGTVVDSLGEPVPGAILAFERIGPYVPLEPDPSEVGRSGSDGTFRVQVPQTEPLYLFAMVPGSAFGFSDAAAVDSRGRVLELEVLLDRSDEVPPDVRGSVLLTLERAPGQSGLMIYAVPRGSSVQRAGVRALDRLLAIDGEPTDDVASARERLAGAPGTDVLLDVIASGRRKSIRVLRESFRR